MCFGPRTVLMDCKMTLVQQQFAVHCTSSVVWVRIMGGYQRKQKRSEPKWAAAGYRLVGGKFNDTIWQDLNTYVCNELIRREIIGVNTSSECTKLACQRQHWPTTLVAEAVKDDDYENKPTILISHVLNRNKMTQIIMFCVRAHRWDCVWDEERGMIRARLWEK
jgi:hypothetical protein